MQEYINKFCILIASHISNPKRIGYLKECIESIMKQTIIIPVYLSVSFETPSLQEFFETSMDNPSKNPLINIVIKNEKTAQMNHYYQLLDVIDPKHQWIMFCDDDDSYQSDRVENLIKSVYQVEEKIKDAENVTFAGIYESHCEKDHREHRHEYWCYCVHIDVLSQFYAKLTPYPDVLDDKCCDVLFAEHLRRSAPTKLFARITEKLYNYRVDNNTDSITGVIQSTQSKYTNLVQAPPRENVAEWAEYAIYWNEYLYENIQVYIHDTYLRTLVGCELDYILRSEFMKNYELVEFVDKCHVEKIGAYHHRLRDICNELYDIKI